MSDLVRNHEDRFSHNEAHIEIPVFIWAVNCSCFLCVFVLPLLLSFTVSFLNMSADPTKRFFENVKGSNVIKI